MIKNIIHRFNKKATERRSDEYFSKSNKTFPLVSGLLQKISFVLNISFIMIFSEINTTFNFAT